MNSEIRSPMLNIKQIFNNLELNNDIQRVIKYLVEGYVKAHGYIEELNGYSFIEEIRAYGIDYVEKNLNIPPPSELQKRKEERKLILEKLYEYIKEKNKEPTEKEIFELTGLDENTLWNHLKYLDGKGLVNFKPFFGGDFDVLNLTSDGIKLVDNGGKIYY